jgi:tetratricopeptide (TPR) repeat protein
LKNLFLFTLSDELLSNNPDNPDLYFNVGVIYQRLGTTLYEDVIANYKTLINQDSPNANFIQSTYSKGLKALDMIQLALDYFIDSSMLEIDENTETEIAMSEMKRLRKNIKDIYLQSIKQIALDNNVTLN